MKQPPSSPTSGANVSTALRKVELQNLPLNLPSEAVAALVMIGQALQSIARSLQGKQAPVALSPTTPPACLDAVTVAQAVNELLRVKCRAGKSDEYLRQLRIHLKKFCVATGNAPLASILPARVEQWVERLEVSERTRHGHLDSVRLLYNFSMRRGYASSNPALVVELPPDSAQFRPATIHTPAQVAKVLHTMRGVDLNVCRFLAVRYFAGLHATEAQRLDESQELLTDRNLIEVKAAKAKTRRRRLVTIHPVLKAWLAVGGVLPVRDINTRMARVSVLSGVPWDRSVTRHSFCSYHLAQWQSASQTALQAGHSEAMLFAHYRELVTSEAAEEFWSLTPERCAEIAALT